MALSFPNDDVATPGRNVGRTLGSGYPPAGLLSVFKGFTVTYKPRRGDHNDRAFDTDTEYETFVRERSYVIPYFNADIRRWIRGAVIPTILNARTHADIVRIADEHKSRALFLGCELLAALAFSNGVYAAARRLRPNLFAPPANQIAINSQSG